MLFGPLVLLAGIVTRRPVAMFLAGVALSALIEAAAALWIHRARSRRGLSADSPLQPVRPEP
ncbi:hypothetical protein [Arthrobacter sp. zg-Y769]|uniref:hypothetical protein n=1 Tax=Arthrobacter sp. zg-Y769 TaxID=2894191 RepID=UPI001E2E6A8D|nr:hypothetical protein [Arthrobacter sp. zg-Y769]MCC9205504.1 hypothetical protein [Arthrobacter sp. zg-Y769]